MAVKFKDLSIEDQNDYRDRMRHSAAHVLAEAVTNLFPEAQLTIGPQLPMVFSMILLFQNHLLLKI